MWVSRLMTEHYLSDRLETLNG